MVNRIQNTITTRFPCFFFFQIIPHWTWKGFSKVVVSTYLSSVGSEIMRCYEITDHIVRASFHPIGSIKSLVSAQFCGLEVQSKVTYTCCCYSVDILYIYIYLLLQCGADYVKTNQRAPVGLEMDTDCSYASLDGDADRLVCYFKSQGRRHYRTSVLNPSMTYPLFFVKESVRVKLSIKWYSKVCQGLICI